MGNVLITGAGTGLGKALAHRYAEEGHQVFLAGRTEKNLLIAQNEIKNKGGRSEVLICDVTEPASITEALRQIDQIDVLINNAGIGLFGSLQELAVEDVEDTLNTNIKGTILMTQSAYPKLKESKGRVLNIISTAGLRGKNHESVYCASKFAVRGFTESLHKEWENEEISATAVYMGGMNTPFWNETDHVDNPDRLKGPEGVAEQIFQEDDGREAIYIDK
ncbi:SDR family oxidoreductase [Halobacillus litoralis]|uniref:SDR family NAD(P)-dependent oxidoreductase n=1 Tax=Halobacillus litoralis TaxID=45668 RepID=UPI001CD23963|nr:SDR family oxidoreductase [Halobacillus litoralis]MCA0971816.1 SDR family oxidoreductase [Halobacillus litoralis]